MEILTVRALFIVLLVVVGSVVAASQELTFSSRAALVVRAVSVVDVAGRPVQGLTADDFVVLEDGVPQTLAFVEFHHLQDDALTPDVQPARGPVDEIRPVTSVGFRSAGPGDDRYQDRRLLVFYFDMAGMSESERLRALLGADTYLVSQMTAADLVAVMTFSGGGVRVEQDFTDDRERLRYVIETMIVGNDRDGDGVPDEPIDHSTAFGQNVGEFNFLRTDRQLAALQTAVTMLRPVTGQKTLVHFVSGLMLTGLDNHAQFSATINAAIRANVTINPVDARGLVAEAPLGGADVASPAGLGAFTGVAAQARRDRFERSQDVLHGLARDTGGTALLNHNDLSVGIRRAASNVTSYYVLGYYTSRPERDGRRRRVTVSVPGRSSVRLAYQDSYVADRDVSRFTAADRERQLEDALMADDPITDVPIAVEVNYFQLNRSEYFVPVSVKMAGDRLTVDRGRRASRTVIDVIGEIKDQAGITVQNVRDRLEIPLTTESVALLAERPIQYETGFTLLPGDYAIKLLARDADSGRIGTFHGRFSIPNLSRETEQVRMSSVVLSQQRLAPSDSLFRVRQRIAADIANPLVSGGTRLLPSVTRVFDASRDVHVLFHAYPALDGPASRFLAFVSVFHSGEKVFEGAAVEVDGTTAVVPFKFGIPEGALVPGAYECQVSVLDLGQGKVAFRRVPFVVVP